jgi:uncharacterized glyoxalase superfamily protein PhnB
MRDTPSTVALLLLASVVATAGCKQNNEASSGKDNTMYKKLTTNMMVEDVNRTVEFYRDVLGLEFVMGVPENSQEVIIARPQDRALAFVIMKAGDVQMMFQAKPSLVEEIPAFDSLSIGGSLTFYIEVEDIEALHAKLRGKVTIVKGIQSKFYGKREFSIRDCNGYILTFAGNI